jgi:hypothetical protein
MRTGCTARVAVPLRSRGKSTSWESCASQKRIKPARKEIEIGRLLFVVFHIETVNGSEGTARGNPTFLPGRVAVNVCESIERGGHKPSFPAFLGPTGLQHAGRRHWREQS